MRIINGNSEYIIGLDAVFGETNLVIREEIIRCKDCKHWYPDADCGMACEFTNMGQPEDGFCNWAHKKVEE